MPSFIQNLNNQTSNMNISIVQTTVTVYATKSYFIATHNESPVLHAKQRFHIQPLFINGHSKKYM